MTSISGFSPAAAPFPLRLSTPSGLAGEAQRLAILCAALLLALALPTALAFMLEDRQLNGIDVWIKPFHFQMALCVHFMTLALLIPLIGAGARQGRLLRWSMRAAVTAAVFEIAYIMTQAARGRHSHFNVETPLEAALYPIAGVGSVLLVTMSLIVGILIFRQRGAVSNSGLRLGATLGLILGSLATLVVAGYMSSGKGHWIGGVHSDAAGLPLLGWSTTGGDLRVPHFFATHMMQALPLAGWLANRWARQFARSLVWAATLVWIALILATFVQALMGLPLLPRF